MAKRLVKHYGIGLLTLCIGALPALAGQAVNDHAMAAHYDFDEGSGLFAQDGSGNGNRASIRGARSVRRGTGYALRFGGGRDCVDCGNGASLDIRDAVTVMLWLRVLAVPKKGEPVVVGKGVNSAYGLTYYQDGVGPTGSRLYFYIGTTWTATPVGLDRWQYIAATFDGRTMCIYVNGEVAARKQGEPREIPPGGNLVMGRGGFVGEIDEVGVHARALTPDEVRSSYVRERQRTFTELSQMESAQSLEGDGFSVHVGRFGALEAARGEDRYRLESSYSYPGVRIGTNRLSAEKPTGENVWTPAVTKPSPNEISIRATAAHYSVERRIEVSAGRVNMSETLTSNSRETVGVIIRHTVSANATPRQILLAGAAVPSIREIPENPTVLMSLRGSHLGMLAEDTRSRVQFEAAATANSADISIRHFALGPGASHTFRWALYPLGQEADYFTLVNRIRTDWNSNFTIDGPFDFAPPLRVCRDADKLRAYLKRKRLKIVAPGPWLDYDNFDQTKRRFETRQEYKDRMRQVAAALKAADPGIRVVGNIEGPFVSLSIELSRKLWEALPSQERGQYYPKVFTPRQLELMRVLPIEQKDSLLYGKEGRPSYELYYRGPKDDRTPLIAILVYPAPGNKQMAFWMDQARFLMEDVGLDGVYIDGSGTVSGGRYSYDKWDGLTVDIDEATGRIARKMTDLTPIIGNLPCRTLFDYVLGRGGALVANGHHYTTEIQSYRIPRFLETGGLYDPLAIGEGEMPRWLPPMCRGHLDAPIALAIHPPNLGEKGVRNYAQVVMKSVITHLRHGLLYYYYNTEIPDTGPGRGEYGPINHMFPITPLELHAGWILGKERIITAKSMDVHWEKPGEPVVHVFDVTGRPVTPTKPPLLENTGPRWHIRLEIDDWEQIAVVE